MSQKPERLLKPVKLVKLVKRKKKVIEKPQVSEQTKDVLLNNLYYSPTTQYTSIKKLYDAVKNKGLTYDEVRTFIQKQEPSQVFKRKKRVRHFFPITARFKFEILQIDLVDVSNMSSANKNYNYLIVAVDIYSRFAFVIPIKDKQGKTVTNALEDVINMTSPLIVNTDLGSEFISEAFVKRMTRQGTDINSVNASQEHNKLSVVDRFVRTLREKINMYMEQHNTTNYIDALQDLVYNYNHTYHSGIRKIPAEVDEIDSHIDKLNNKKYLKALPEEEIFNIGQRVRYSLQRGRFSKGTLSKWSKTIHTIISSTPHSYILDNGKAYKYYDIQPVDDVEKLDKPAQGPSEKQMTTEKTLKRKQKKEGIDLTNIVSEKRERKQTDRFKY